MTRRIRIALAMLALPFTFAACGTTESVPPAGDKPSVEVEAVYESGKQRITDLGKGDIVTEVEIERMNGETITCFIFDNYNGGGIDCVEPEVAPR